MSSVLLLGQGNAIALVSAKLWRFGIGATDDGLPIYVVAESNWIPVDLVDQEFTFYTAYLTVTWSMGVILRITPEVDQAANTEVSGDYTFVVDQPLLTLPGGATRRTQTFEFQLVVKTRMTADPTIEIRNNCRGARMRIQLESQDPGLDDDYLAIDAFRVELEPVQETIQSEASA